MKAARQIDVSEADRIAIYFEIIDSYQLIGRVYDADTIMKDTYNDLSDNMRTNLEIVFLTKNFDMNRASYRIWVDYLAKCLNAIDVNASIYNIGQDYPYSANVVLFDKGIPGEAIALAKQKFKKGIVSGAINPPAQSQLPVDFVIAGSREEECSLSNYPHVIFVPLVELPFHSLPTKQHVDREVIRVCYHGNSLHLSSFESSGLKSALEKFHHELHAVNRKLILTVVSNKENPKWLIGKPNVEIQYARYNWETFHQILEDQDIGIVPNSYYLKPATNFFKRLFNPELSKTDIVMRMKNKSNFGRLLVFMQASIPAVADLTPSHLELLADRHNGFCASNELGWLQAFRVLSVASERNRVAENARKFAMSKFQPEDWAASFVEEIEKLTAANILNPI